MASKKRTVSEIMKTEKAEEVEKKSKEIASWIESQLKEKLPKPVLREALLDGVVLCKLMNALAPGALKRYHKKPRMLAMKIENIGFFLATCKSRMNLPAALLFQPTDIHDDSNNLASMSKVLNVLAFLRGDGEDNMIQALEDDDDPNAEPATVVQTPTAPPPSTVTPPPSTVSSHSHHEQEPEEPEPEPEEPEPEPIHAPVATPVSAYPSSSPAPTSSSTAHATPTPASYSTPAPISSNTAPAPISSATNHASSTNSNYAEVQTEVLKAISEVINAELSIESKRKLVRILQHQVTSFEEKIMNSSDDLLAVLAKECGVDEMPKNKGREASIDVLMKFGRVQ